MSLASSLLTKGNELRSKSASTEKTKMKIAELIRMCNANDSKFEQINNNVA